MSDHEESTTRAARVRITRASQALAKRFSKRHGAQKEAAELTQVPQHRLSRLASGKRFPWADEAARISAHLDIPVAWWDERPREENDAAAE